MAVCEGKQLAVNNRRDLPLAVRGQLQTVIQALTQHTCNDFDLIVLSLPYLSLLFVSC